MYKEWGHRNTQMYEESGQTLHPNVDTETVTPKCTKKVDSVAIIEFLG